MLFGSIFGLSAAQAMTAAADRRRHRPRLLCIARPLLFASIDEAVAAARGLPVRSLGVGFLALVGATAAEATQAVGALLLLGLLAAPAGTALLLTDRPYRGLAISAGLAVADMWAGLALAYAVPPCRRASRSSPSPPPRTSPPTQAPGCTAGMRERGGRPPRRRCDRGRHRQASGRR